MINVLFLDKDDLYCKSVCAKLNSQQDKDYLNFYDYEAYVKRFVQLKSDLSETNSDNEIECPLNYTDLTNSNIDWDDTIVIYNPMQYQMPDNISFTILLCDVKPNNSEISNCLFKFESVKSMLSFLLGFVAEHPQLLKNTQENNLACISGTACPSLAQEEMLKFRKEKLSEGYKVITIDICPPYFCEYFPSKTTGFNLSDALLRVMADDLNAEEIGLFLSLKPDGSMQFNPIERSDDFYECTPDNYRRFVEIIRKWIKHSNNNYYVIIFCYAVPFSYIYSIAVLCDKFILLNQENDPVRTKLFIKELNFLLSNLPSSCKVTERLLSCNK